MLESIAQKFGKQEVTLDVLKDNCRALKEMISHYIPLKSIVRRVSEAKNGKRRWSNQLAPEPNEVVVEEVYAASISSANVLHEITELAL